MSPFVEAELPEEFTRPEAYMRKFGVGYEQAVSMAAQMCSERYVINDKYQVHISDVHFSPDWPPFIHLSIKRIDKEPVHDWRDIQEIKNMLVGPENEAIEIYPAESRLVDCANQYHLWVMADESVRIPVGWNKRMVCTSEEASVVGAKQRERECNELGEVGL